mgnify:CR=1 FL=1
MIARRALVDRLRALPAERRAALLDALSPRAVAALRWDWEGFWARPDDRAPGWTEGRGQLPPPGDWTWWGNIGGRASGKTTAAVEWVHSEARTLGRGCVIHLLGQTLEDARAVMVEGESGLLAKARPWDGIDFKPSIGGGLITWRSGAKARVFGADKPAKGRGPQCNRMWLDDPAAFGVNGMAVLEQLLFGFRLRAPDGSEPRGVISSTPIESELMRWILGGPRGERRSKVLYSRSTTDDNRSNLAESFFTQTLEEFAGTELEQQERYAIFPWGAKKIFANVDFKRPPVRVDVAPDRFLGVAIWIDPAQSTSTKACEVGMVAAGVTHAGKIFLLDDSSDVMGADVWPERALDLHDRWAGRTAAIHLGVETNRGGNQPAELLRSAEIIRKLREGRPGVATIEIRSVFTHQGKTVRATPLPRLYLAGQVHHLPGLDGVERQLRELDDTPRLQLDRADAAVYCVLDLAGILEQRGGSSSYAVGGVALGPGTFGPAAAGAVNVGPAAQRSAVPMSMPGMSFSFGGGSGR